METVRPLAATLLAAPRGEMIDVDSMEYAIKWAFMFHETGLALQQCMVPKLRMRPMQHKSGSGTTPFVDDGASVTASETESTTKKDREKITSFQQPIYWGGHAVIMSKKFEDRIVSASYMTQVCTTCSLHPQLRRHNASSVLTSSLSAWCAGVFAHPHWSGRSAGWWAQNWPADVFCHCKETRGGPTCPNHLEHTRQGAQE